MLIVIYTETIKEVMCMGKKIIVYLILLISIFSLTACVDKEVPAEIITYEDWSATVDTVDGKPLADYLQKKYPLESEQVKIYCYGNPEPVAVITDESDINALQESVQFGNWIKYENDQYKGMWVLYIQFNENTIIATYNDIPYGILGTGPIDVDMENMVMNVSNPEGYFDMSKEFLQTVNKMVEKYSK